MDAAGVESADGQVAVDAAAARAEIRGDEAGNHVRESLKVGDTRRLDVRAADGGDVVGNIGDRFAAAGGGDLDLVEIGRGSGCVNLRGGEDGADGERES